MAELSPKEITARVRVVTPDPSIDVAYLVFPPFPNGSKDVVGFPPGPDGLAAAASLAQLVGQLVVAVPVIADYRP